MQDFVSKHLSDAGHKVTVCADGNLAYDHILTEVPDLILLDLDLPGTSGLEILKAVRANEEYKTVPIIIFSNNDTPELKTAVITAGATDYYFKATTNPTELNALVSSHL